MSQEKMFCYQCEQTVKGQGCTSIGVCGKTPEVATLQDLLIYTLRGLSRLTIEAQKVGIETEYISVFTCEALFATLTNVNFDPNSIIRYVRRAAELHKRLRNKIQSAGGHDISVALANLVLEETKEGLIAQGKLVGIKF
jgi:hydroxylamine reductase